MPSVSFRAFQGAFALQAACVVLRVWYGDVWGGVCDIALLYLGIKAAGEQSPLMYWFYILPSFFEGAALFAALAVHTADAAVAKLPPWLVLATATVNVASAALALRLATKLASRSLLPTSYMRPDALGRLVYTRGDTVSDMMIARSPEHIKYHAVSLSSDDD